MLLQVISLLCFSTSIYADFNGQVVGVADGDTLTVVREQRQVRVRLLEIDAPEKTQAFGRKSKQSLSEPCFGKMAHLAEKGKDRYGRTLARVTCEGIDANAEQVRRGMAWVYDRYVTDQSLYQLQNNAKAAHIGLWRDAKPLPPWEWRKEKRND